MLSLMTSQVTVLWFCVVIFSYLRLFCDWEKDGSLFYFRYKNNIISRIFGADLRFTITKIKSWVNEGEEEGDYVCN